MTPSQDFARRRIAARTELLDAVVAASRQHGASALHLVGSLGRREADVFSDIDAWLTFPDEAIETAVRSCHDLYHDVGDLLLTHEAAGNRPLSGVYTLALYLTTAGPVQVDWYLAPQQTSRVAHDARGIFERVPVPRGAWLLDVNAEYEQSRAERINWLIGMHFIAIKVLARGGDATFLTFLEGAYREAQESYRLGGMPVADPTSLAAVADMLGQLAPYCDATQRRALLAVEAFARDLRDQGRPIGAEQRRSGNRDGVEP